MAAQADDDSDDFQQGRIPNAQEQILKHRLEDIKDARVDLRNARSAAMGAIIRGNANETKAAEYYHAHLKNFLFELRPFAEKDATARAFWSGDGRNDIGVVPVQPPPRDSDLWSKQRLQEPDRSKQSHDDLESESVASWDGLIDVMRSETKFRHTFEFVENTPNLGWHVYTCTVETAPPFQALDMATEWAYNFARYVGFEINLTSDRPLGKYG